MDFMTTHRMKVLAFALLYLFGCNTPDVPDPAPIPDQAIELKAPGYNDDQDILAVSLAKFTDMKSPNPVDPTPAPDTPKVGDTCSVCNGRGKSGDGIQPCEPCKGDGRLDAGDPGLSSSSQEKTEEEHSVVVEYARQDKFNAFVEETAGKNEQLSIANQELIGKLENTVGKIENLNARINELEARIQAIDDECKCDEKPAKTASPEYGYRILYKGEYYVWKGDGEFQSPNGWKLSYPHLKGATAERLEVEPPVRICPPGETCTEAKIEKFDKSLSPEMKVMPEPALKTPPPSKEVSFQFPSYPLRASSSWWSGCSSWQHLTGSEHTGKFNRDWLRSLSWAELQSLHSDDHDGKVKWSYVMR